MSETPQADFWVVLVDGVLYGFSNDEDTAFANAKECGGVVVPLYVEPVQNADLREALDALEGLYKVAAPNSYPLTVFNAAVKATEGAQSILRKHGRAV